MVITCRGVTITHFSPHSVYEDTKLFSKSDSPPSTRGGHGALHCHTASRSIAWRHPVWGKSHHAAPHGTIWYRHRITRLPLCGAYTRSASYFAPTQFVSNRSSWFCVAVLYTRDTLRYNLIANFFNRSSTMCSGMRCLI